jgi:hypothetical protein
MDAAAVEGTMPLPSNVAIRRDVYLSNGGFDPLMRTAEDDDLWFRLGDAPGVAVISSPPTLVREVHDENLGEHTGHSFRGMCLVVRRERNGMYPGGRDERRVRRALITSQLMYYAVQYTHRGKRRLAWRFYLDVLRFQVVGRFAEASFGGRRNRFLLSFPLLLASPGFHQSARTALRRLLNVGPGRRLRARLAAH